MAAKPLILEIEALEAGPILADAAEIRRYNPQRFEMEQLTAITYEDHARHVCGGYKDLTPGEFWIRGHLPGVPVMPGVIMCEAAAQMCSYFAAKYGLITDRMVGLGGLDEVRFRDVVRPGDRLWIVARLLRMKRNVMVVCEFQEFVNRQLVCEGQIRGVALPPNEVPAPQRSISDQTSSG